MKTIDYKLRMKVIIAMIAVALVDNHYIFRDKTIIMKKNRVTILLISVITLVGVGACFAAGGLYMVATQNTHEPKTKAIKVLQDSLRSNLSLGQIEVVGEPHFTDGMGVDF